MYVFKREGAKKKRKKRKPFVFLLFDFISSPSFAVCAPPLICKKYINRSIFMCPIAIRFMPFEEK